MVARRHRSLRVPEQSSSPGRRSLEASELPEYKDVGRCRGRHPRTARRGTPSHRRSSRNSGGLVVAPCSLLLVTALLVTAPPPDLELRQRAHEGGVDGGDFL